MKKILIAATLIIASLSLAGTKEDYEKAISKYESNKSISELQKSLLDISKSKTSDEYTRKANLDLASIKVNENKLADAKVYLNNVVNDKKASNSEKEKAYSGLYQIADLSNNNEEKVKYIDKLVSLNSSNQEYKILQIIDYTTAKNSKAKTLYNSFVSKLKTEEKEGVNALLATAFIEANNLTEAKKYANYNINSKTNEVKAGANFLLAQVAAVESKIDEAIKYAGNANTILKDKNANVLILLLQLNTAKGEFDKAYNYATKLLEVDKSESSYIYYILQAELVNKTKEAEKAVSELKAKLSTDEEKKELNLYISNTLLESGLLDAAQRYANKALNDDKKEQAHLLLSIIYANKNDKANALKEAEAAKKANVNGADELIKQINENLK